MSIFPFDHRHYVAALRAKRGEYTAVSNLTAAQREHVTPLWELQPFDDIDAAGAGNEFDQYLTGHARQVVRAWGNNRCFVDAELLDDGSQTSTNQHPLEFFCNDLIDRNGAPVPVTSPEYTSASHAAAEAINQRHDTGICVRVTPQAVDVQTVRPFCDGLMQHGARALDLIVDLEYVTEETLRLVTPFLPPMLQRLTNLYEWRTVTLLMGSFPAELASSGRGHLVFSRPEWVAWRVVLGNITPPARNPAYGDYAVSHPHFIELPPFVAASANIRYTGEAEWHIFRGRPVATMGPVRGHGFGQYRDLADNCRTTVPPYRGAPYSYGDQYIDDCADGRVGTGNNTTWRAVGTNQHIVYAAELATRP